MLNVKIQEALNKQVKVEGDSSQTYLAMAVWAEIQGYSGISKFMYTHADEERQHMLKLIKYINERGGEATVPELAQPEKAYKSVRAVFETLLSHEQNVTDQINHLVFMCLDEKDYTTHNFLQWYVSEQLEEEALARQIMDKIKIIGDDKSGLYLFDRDIVKETANSAGTAQ